MRKVQYSMAASIHIITKLPTHLNIINYFMICVLSPPVFILCHWFSVSKGLYSSWVFAHVSSTENVAMQDFYLTAPLLWERSQRGLPVVTATVRCCFHDAKEWLVLWSWKVGSDTQWEIMPHLGEENIGGMWNLGEQGHSKGHDKMSPVSLSLSIQGGLIPVKCRIVWLNLFFVWEEYECLLGS